jgi:hypothetical protein
MINIVREAEDMGTEHEKCFKCGTPTPYWAEVRDVPCCPDCANLVQNSDVPLKQEWITG